MIPINNYDVILIIGTQEGTLIECKHTLNPKIVKDDFIINEVDFFNKSEVVNMNCYLAANLIVFSTLEN